MLFHGFFLKYKNVESGVKVQKNPKKGAATASDRPNSDQFNGQGVQPLVDEILHRIIHKAVALHPHGRRDRRSRQ
jgi:hypothetical protein